MSANKYHRCVHLRVKVFHLRVYRRKKSEVILRGRFLRAL